MSAQALTVVSPQELTASPTQLSALEVKGQVQRIQEIMQAVMQEGFHYGVIPGTDKPTLLKPGAEKLTLTFRLAPKITVEVRNLDNGHREYQVTCALIHIPTGQMVGEGVGSCSTMESKYRYRNAKRQCPMCGKETIIKGKAEYGGGWLCFAKQGGCGAKFAADDLGIVDQETGKVENPDLADQYNTILKMAKKRALIDATLTATAASDCFTQDLDDAFDAAPQAPAPRSETAPLRETSERQASSQAAARSRQPSPPVPPRLITKGQYEILLLSMRRSQLTQQKLEEYVFPAYNVADLKDLSQQDLNLVLEWIEGQQEQKMSVHERQEAAIQSEPTTHPLPTITPLQIGLLMKECTTCGVPLEVLQAHIKEKGWPSRKDIPTAKFDELLEWVRAAKATE